MSEEIKKFDLADYRPKLTGRPAGATNKETRLRNEMMREKILETNIIFNSIDEINERISDPVERKKIRMSELINIITKCSPYIYQTVSEEQIEQAISQITSREDAEKQIAQLNEAVGFLRAVK